MLGGIGGDQVSWAGSWAPHLCNVYTVMINELLEAAFQRMLALFAFILEAGSDGGTPEL